MLVSIGEVSSVVSTLNYAEMVGVISIKIVGKSAG